MTTDLKNNAFYKIFTDFESFSNLILKQVDLLTEIFDRSEKNISKKIIAQLSANENKIDEFENKLDNHIVRAIVLYKPVASDLRHLFAMYRMVINLERIGDLIIKISKHESLIDSSSELKNMLKLTSEMLKNALLSFFNSDQKLATWTIERDDLIDKIDHEFLSKRIENINLEKESKTLLLNLINKKTIASCFERIADHSTNIAEASIYSLLGKNVRHKNKDISDEL
ncbi:MAG: phosphate uptake regulator PhoU [Bacteroidales bacterium]|jgi:phosphate transport system protein|nr:phosphate uptake regulator PhoU [Bacteroidales bacterium]